MQQRDIPATNEEKAGYYHNLYLNEHYEDLQAKIYSKQGVANMTVSDFKSTFRTSCTDGIIGDNSTTIKNNSNDALADETVETVISENLTLISNANTVSSGLKTFIANFIEDGQEIDNVEDMEDFTGDAWDYATANFQSTEKSIAQSTIWVYRYSFVYWSEHADEWQALIDPNGNEPDPIIKLGKYGSADASGFTSGAITGAILGGSVTVGTMTGPGWLVGGCIGGLANSAGAIIGDLWDWIWS